MTDPIVRVYEDEQQARRAAGRLREEGFRPDEIFLVTPVSPPPVTPTSEAPVPGEELAPPPRVVSDAFLAGQCLGKQARRYAAHVEDGRSLVAIRPPLGYAQLAMNILEAYGPLETEPPRPQRSSVAWDEAAPLSSALQLTTIKRHQPAPFSGLLGLTLLSTGGRSAFSRMFGELTTPDFALFGRPRLVHEAAPLSSLFHLKTISRSKGPWRSSLGLPLLSRNPAPLSSALGLHTLTDRPLGRHPAPFSAVLGLPTLSRGRTFLSRLFGELANPHFAAFGRSALSRQAAPLSSLLGLKTVSGRSGAAWRRSFGAPMLMKGSHTSFGFPLLSHGRSLLSRVFGELTSPHFALFGRSRLSRKPAPLSSLLGLKTLSGRAGAAWRRSFGLPMLIRSGSPTSLGLPLLARNPAPLSSLLGLRVLSRDQ